MLDTEACRDTSCSTWRPGTLPLHADHLVVDEWTYLFAMRCDERDVPARAAWLMPHLGAFGASFFAGFESVVDLFARRRLVGSLHASSGVAPSDAPGVP